MKVKCKNCGHTLDPNSTAHERCWGPPKNPRDSVGSLTCPACSHKADFIEWTTITSQDVKVVARSVDKEV